MPPTMTRVQRALGTHATVAAMAGRELDDRWCVFGVPYAFDSQQDVSPSGGPAAIRGAVPYFDLEAPDVRLPLLWDFDRRAVIDLRSVAPLDLGDLSAPGSRSPDELLPDIEFLAAAIKHRHGRPLILGGEHWLSLPVVRALARYEPAFHVVHFDAHTDRQWPDDRDYPLFNGNVISFVRRTDRVGRIFHMGVREYEWGSFDGRGPYDDGRTSLRTSMELLAEPNPARCYAELPLGAAIYLSIDVDVLDPSVAPEVAWPVAGGLDLGTLLRHVEWLASNYRLIGVDLVELVGNGSRLNLGALALGRTLMTIIGSTPATAGAGAQP